MVKSKRSKESPASLFDPLVEGAKKHLIELAKSFIDEKVQRLQKIGISIGLALFFFFVGLFFILTTLVFALHESFHVSYSLSFLFTGLGAVLVSIFIYFWLQKGK